MNSFNIQDFEINSESLNITSCPIGYMPLESAYNESEKAIYAKFEVEHCSKCNYFNQCPSKIKSKYSIVKFLKDKESTSHNNFQTHSNQFHKPIKKHDKIYDRKGNLVYDGEILDSYQHGSGKLYYPGGTVEYEGQFQYNYALGKGTHYYENGNVRWEGIFDKITEYNLDYSKLYKRIMETSYAFIDQFSRIVSGKAFRENGTLEYEGQFEFGQPHGRGKLYDENGDLIFVGTFFEGKPTGQNELDVIPNNVREIIGTYEEYLTAEDAINDIDKSPYNVWLGIKYFVLADLFLLKSQFMKKRSNKTKIDFLISDITNLTHVESIHDSEKTKEKYAIVLNEMIEAQSDELFRSFNNSVSIWDHLDSRKFLEDAINQEISDRDMVALKCCNRILKKLDVAYKDLIGLVNPLFNFYLILTYIKVIRELLENTKEYIPIASFKLIINIHVNNDGNFIKFTVQDKLEECKNHIISPEINVCVLENDNTELYLKDTYKKLSENGRILFSTGEIMFQYTNINRELTIDYWPFISSYIKCIEYELRYRLGEILISNIPGMKDPLTLGSFNYAFKKFGKILGKLLTKEISQEMINDFDSLLLIRNKNTHDSIFSFDDYQKVRELIVTQKLLEQIITIEPIEKNILFEGDENPTDSMSICKISVHGELRSIIDYKAINNLGIFNDSLTTIDLLNKYTDAYLNFPFMINESQVFSQYISTEINQRAIGKIEIMDCTLGRCIYSLSYDYVGLHARDSGIDLFYRATINEKDLHIAGTLSLDDENDSVGVIGDENLKTIRKYIYSKLFSDINEAALKNTYIKYLGMILAEMIKHIENNNVVKELIHKIMESQDVWLSKETQVIHYAYNLSKELLLILFRNLSNYDLKMKCIIIEACGYITDNMDRISDSEECYVYPYTIIKVKDTKVLEVTFEKLKSAGNERTIFEVIDL